MSNISDPCHIWMSPVTCERVMSHVNAACLVTTIHAIFGWFMSRMNESCHAWASHVPYECVISRMDVACHVWMIHVMYEWFMSYMNDSCHVRTNHVTYECVMSRIHTACHSRIWMIHHLWSHMKDSSVTYDWDEWVHVRMSHVPSRWACASRNGKKGCTSRRSRHNEHVRLEITKKDVRLGGGVTRVLFRSSRHACEWNVSTHDSEWVLFRREMKVFVKWLATHCNTPQNTATHRNTSQRTATQ